MVRMTELAKPPGQPLEQVTAIPATAQSFWFGAFFSFFISMYSASSGQ